jgi:peptidoglycan hydrolase-like protein with peptidoglycan-binding domain
MSQHAVTPELTTSSSTPLIPDLPSLSGNRPDPRVAVAATENNPLVTDLNQFKNILAGTQFVGENIPVTPESSEQIQAVQSALKELGVYSGEVNGSMDGATVEAIKAFQGANQVFDENGVGHKLVPDGVVGPLTSRAIFLALQRSTAATLVSPDFFKENDRLQNGLQSADIQVIAQRLDPEQDGLTVEQENSIKRLRQLVVEDATSFTRNVLGGSNGWNLGDGTRILNNFSTQSTNINPSDIDPAVMALSSKEILNQIKIKGSVTVDQLLVLESRGELPPEMKQAASNVANGYNKYRSAQCLAAVDYGYVDAGINTHMGGSGYAAVDTLIANYSGLWVKVEVNNSEDLAKLGYVTGTVLSYQNPASTGGHGHAQMSLGGGNWGAHRPQGTEIDTYGGGSYNFAAAVPIGRLLT